MAKNMLVSSSFSNIELCSVPSDYGRGANDGAYYPVGLLTIGTHLRRILPRTDVTVVDLHHSPDFVPSADLVGISASSTLNYRNVLKLAKKAKDAGAVVVLGGPHATQLPNQILRNRGGLIDYVVRGNSERAFTELVAALQNSFELSAIPGLSWLDEGGEVRHNSLAPQPWKYDDFLPLDLSILRPGLQAYWSTFKANIDPTIDAALVLFTHFGCGYRKLMKDQNKVSDQRLAKWCSYCSLSDPMSARTGNAIVREALRSLRLNGVSTGSKVLLKCYGDNVGTQLAMLADLASTVKLSDEWNQYQIGWTFYAQSSRVSVELLELLKEIRTWNLYIGFDSADDRVQRLNGLGTSISGHRRSVDLCLKYRIKIQAGFVLGCGGETQQSLDNTLRFADEIASKGALERINSAVLVIVPGSPAYQLLCEKEPWIRDLDELPTEELQWYWIRHFCPSLANSPSDALAILRQAANRLDELSPGPHASMGFISDRLVPNPVSRGAATGAYADLD
jgi:radical SAM superfamily enzyme YgiQ (UPF0313 family)